MLNANHWDPVTRLMVELRDDDEVAAIAGQNPSEPVSARVRGQEPAPSDKQPPKTWRAFVVIVTLATPPLQSVPVQRTRHAVRCYGRTKEEAQALYRACTAVLHHQGPRLTGSGDGIYVSHDDTGAGYGTDPDTNQPSYTFIVEALATTQVVTA